MRFMRKRWLQTAVKGSVLVLLVVASACGGSNNTSSSTATTKSAGTPLRATEKEYAIAFDPGTVSAGRIRLTVKNAGTIEHELVAFRTDLAETDLPMGSGEVDEEGAGITHIDPEAEDIAPSSAKTITLNLTAGRYVFLCNVPGHYQLGMHAVLTVS
jgi:uncharacterized cupredoxin-like copper-binding protein